MIIIRTMGCFLEASPGDKAYVHYATLVLLVYIESLHFIVLLSLSRYGPHGDQ